MQRSPGSVCRILFFGLPPRHRRCTCAAPPLKTMAGALGRGGKPGFRWGVLSSALTHPNTVLALSLSHAPRGTHSLRSAHSAGNGQECTLCRLCNIHHRNFPFSRINALLRYAPERNFGRGPSRPECERPSRAENLFLLFRRSVLPSLAPRSTAAITPQLH